MQRREPLARGPPKVEVTRAGRPDRSIVIASNADGLPGAGKLVIVPSAATWVSGKLLFPVHTEPRSPAATPNSCSCACGSPTVVSAARRSRSRPEFVATHTALPIDQYLPDGIGTESLLRREAFAWSRFHRHRRWPSLHMVEPLHALAGHRPQRTIGSEGEVAELSIPLVTLFRGGEKAEALNLLATRRSP